MGAKLPAPRELIVSQNGGRSFVAKSLTETWLSYVGSRVWVANEEPSEYLTISMDE